MKGNEQTKYHHQQVQGWIPKTQEKYLKITLLELVRVVSDDLKYVKSNAFCPVVAKASHKQMKKKDSLKTGHIQKNYAQRTYIENV